MRDCRLTKGTAGGDPVSDDCGCPAIACAVGLQLSADFPLSFEACLGAQFEACRNDNCQSSQLSATTMPPPSGTGFVVHAPSSWDGYAEHADFALWNDDRGGLWLDFRWTPRTADDLRDGDHYLATVTTVDGKRHVLVDQAVTYTDVSNSAPDKPCYQHCVISMIDQRTH